MYQYSLAMILKMAIKGHENAKSVFNANTTVQMGLISPRSSSKHGKSKKNNNKNYIKKNKTKLNKKPPKKQTKKTPPKNNPADLNTTSFKQTFILLVLYCYRVD